MDPVCILIARSMNIPPSDLGYLIEMSPLFDMVHTVRSFAQGVDALADHAQIAAELSKKPVLSVSH